MISSSSLLDNVPNIDNQTKPSSPTTNIAFNIIVAHHASIAISESPSFVSFAVLPPLACPRERVCPNLLSPPPPPPPLLRMHQYHPSSMSSQKMIAKVSSSTRAATPSDTTVVRSVRRCRPTCDWRCRRRAGRTVPRRIPAERRPFRGSTEWNTCGRFSRCAISPPEAAVVVVLRRRHDVPSRDIRSWSPSDGTPTDDEK
mmetsp:Transcript_9178/g.19818  ORF Transcript_9178/g.19818 Transcript_9178/m.19818 type:complete len:200 (-) Transcript_9178:553-1152(-)